MNALSGNLSVSSRTRTLFAAFITAVAIGCTSAAAQAENYSAKTATVEGIKIHYLISGTGQRPLVVLHGFGETSHMWVRLFEEFGKDFTIIAPDLPGIGDSLGKSAIRDKKTAASQIRGLVKSLGYEKIDLIGHDIGLMVAYAYAAQFPDEVQKLALLEAPIPGIGEAWTQIYNDPRLWHFHFVDSSFALPLVKGRERIFLDHFWEEMTPNSKAMPEESRIIYTKSYAQPGVMEAAFKYFKAFDRQDATDNKLFAATKLKMPVLTIAGEKSMGAVLGTQAKLVAVDVTSTIIPATGHWLLEEKPAEVKAALRTFFAN